jgi:hypothetical protein
MGSWILKNWKKVLVAGCGVVGAVATVVPALIPAAATCALVVPAVTGAPTVVDALKSVLGMVPPAK